jgi:hypothetical protein
MRATDIKFTARQLDTVDRAIESSSESIDSLCHRRFYNVDATMYWDWPNFQRAYPWRLWFDEREIADVTINVPVVTTGGIVIPANQIKWGPWNYSPPYTFLELDRSSNAAFGYGSTPQQDISIASTFGYWVKTASAGSLAATITTTTSINIQVTNSNAPGVGDVMTVNSERMLVTDRNMITTGQTQIGTGCSTVSAADCLLAVASGAAFNINEVILLDAERMLIVDIAGNTLSVKRSWDGTVLAAHTGATVYAGRQLTVTRGDFGTTATIHSNAVPITVSVPPSMVRDLSLAESIVQTLEETGGYTGSQGSGAGKTKNIGVSLSNDLGISRTNVYNKFGRKTRHRVV